MSAHREDDLDNGTQGSANADEQRRTSFSSGTTTLDTPQDYYNNIEEITRICNTGSPDDYHNSSPVWVGQSLGGSQAPASYATTQTSLSACDWGSQPCMLGGESDGQNHPVLSPGYWGSRALIGCCTRLVDSQATQPTNSRMISGQVGQPPSSYPSGDGVSRNNLDDTYCESSLPTSSSDQFCHELPSPQ